VFRGRKMGETFAISKLYEESLDINIKYYKNNKRQLKYRKYYDFHKVNNLY